jgi:Xaa-Pro aminopeptidase
LTRATLALDEMTPFFRYDGIRRALQDTNLISGKPIIGGCRSRKSAAEIALMQRANDITLPVAKLYWTAHALGRLQCGSR